MAEIHERFCCLYAAQSEGSMRPEHNPDCQNYFLTNRDGSPIYCGHTGCWRRAKRIVGYENPKHREFEGQTHDCCAVHSRP